MGKPNKKTTDDDFEDDMDEDQPAAKGKTGPIPPAKLEKTAKSVEKLKADMDKIRGDLGSEFKQFEEDGGHKLAFKLALKVKSMATIQAQEFIRSFEQYCHELGIYDQHDLFDPLEAKNTKGGKTTQKAGIDQRAAGTA